MVYLGWNPYWKMYHVTNSVIQSGQLSLIAVHEFTTVNALACKFSRPQVQKPFKCLCMLRGFFGVLSPRVFVMVSHTFWKFQNFWRYPRQNNNRFHSLTIINGIQLYYVYFNVNRNINYMITKEKILKKRQSWQYQCSFTDLNMVNNERKRKPHSSRKNKMFEISKRKSRLDGLPNTAW